MRENLHLNHVVPEFQITNKVNKERDKRKHRSHEKNYSNKLLFTVRSLLAKPDKITFLNEPKQTELAKQKHGVDTMHTNIFVTFGMSFATPQSTALLYFLKKLFTAYNALP